MYKSCVNVLQCDFRQPLSAKEWMHGNAICFRTKSINFYAFAYYGLPYLKRYKNGLGYFCCAFDVVKWYSCQQFAIVNYNSTEQRHRKMLSCLDKWSLAVFYNDLKNHWANVDNH